MAEPKGIEALCEILGLRYPIIQAPMNWVTNAQFVAEVSNTGALGVLGPNAGAGTISDDPAAVAQRLARQIDLTRELTAHPFAVNFPIGLGSDRRFSDACVEVGIHKRIPIALTSMGSPEIYTTLLKDSGIKVVHTVASVRQAVKAEDAGVDAVICQGTEAGGHLGALEMSNLVLVPMLAPRMRIPVIAAGAIVNAVGYRAMLALGSAGVCMGTRFLATVESPAHPNVKRAIVEADEGSLAIWGRGWGLARGLRNRFVEGVLEGEETAESLKNYRELSASYKKFGSSVNRIIGGMINGDVDEGEIYLGQGAVLIDSIDTVKEVVRTLLESQ